MSKWFKVLWQIFTYIEIYLLCSKKSKKIKKNREELLKEEKSGKVFFKQIPHHLLWAAATQKLLESNLFNFCQKELDVIYKMRAW